MPVLAFPTIPVVDSFTSGATQNLTARPGWFATTTFGNTAPTYATDSVPTYAVGSGASPGNFWGTVFGSRQAISAVLSLMPAASVGNLMVRASGNNTFYFISYNNNSSAWAFQKWVNGATTILGGGGTQNVSTGDAVGLVADGPVLSAQYQAGATGPWTEVGTFYDYSLPCGGLVGIGATQATLRYGAISAGTIGPDQGIGIVGRAQGVLG